MATQSNIEWTDCTWNPVIGCRHVAEGCRHCYAETMSKRLAAMGQRDYASILTKDGTFNGKAITRPATLAEPLHWKKPRMVFVNSMSDLFHEDVPFEFIAAVFGVMAACPQHTFQVLTKRPERALEFFEWIKTAPISEPFERGGKQFGVPRELTVCSMQLEAEAETDADRASFGSIYEMAGAVVAINKPAWPLKNVWLGVSAAAQLDADKLVPIVLKCPAAVRFVSAEPLIREVFLQQNWINALLCQACGTKALDWVIVGGESGPGARPCDVAWIRSIVEQCKAAGVPVFVKQLGSNSQEQFGGSGALRPRLKSRNIKGGDPDEWPEDLRVREWPTTEKASA